MTGIEFSKESSNPRGKAGVQPKYSAVWKEGSRYVQWYVDGEPLFGARCESAMDAAYSCTKFNESTYTEQQAYINKIMSGFGIQSEAGVALIKDLSGVTRFMPLGAARKMERAGNCKILRTGKSIGEIEKQM